MGFCALTPVVYAGVVKKGFVVVSFTSIRKGERSKSEIDEDGNIGGGDGGERAERKRLARCV